MVLSVGRIDPQICTEMFLYTLTNIDKGKKKKETTEGRDEI